MENVLVHYSVPFLAGIGGLVVLVVVAVRFLGVKIRFPNGSDSLQDTALHEGYRRQGDELLAEFLKVSRDQASMMQKIVDTQENFGQILSKQTDIMHDLTDGGKEMSRDMKSIYRKLIGDLK